MTAPTLTPRIFNGMPLPSAGGYAIDPAHTHVGFSVRHLMVARVKGRFSAVTGNVTIGEEPLESVVDVSVETASIDTHDAQRDAHLRSADFFDVEVFPAMTFTSTNLRPAGSGGFELEGLLTIKDITRPVTLRGEVEGVGPDPWGNERAGFSAVAEIDREAWGLTWNQALETGGVLVGRSVTLEIEAEIVRS